MNPAVKDPENVIIIGCGDIGMRVAQHWQAQHIPVYGVVRQPQSLERLEKANISAQQIDLDEPIDLGHLPMQNSFLYYFAPPPAKGIRDTRMQQFLVALAKQPHPCRLTLISTSGVYGDQGGKLINEDTPANPQADRARRRLDAETQCRKFGQQHQMAVITLRVGGIYGPGRLPIKRLQAGTPIIHEALAPKTNRIHADDLAQICVAAAQRGRADSIYNVSDGSAGNMTEYFNTVADNCGLPRPPTIGWEEAEQTLSDGMLSYLKESRCMDNRRMLTELGIQLKYPDLLSGLRDNDTTDSA